MVSPVAHTFRTTAGLTFLLAVLWAGVASVGLADNVLSVSDAEGTPGDTVTVAISVDNDSSFVGLQVDLSHPLAAGYVDGSATLTDRADGHTLQVGEVSPDTLRLVAFSTGQEPFSGNEGAVVELQFVVGTDPGTGALDPNNAVLADAAQNNILTDTEAGTFTTVAPDISVNPSSFDFGSQPLTSETTATLTVSNEGNDTLRVEDWTTTNPLFSVQDTSEALLLGGESTSRTLVFSADEEGTFQDTLMAASTDPDSPQEHVDLAATAFPVNEVLIDTADASSGDTVRVTASMQNMSAVAGGQVDLDLPEVAAYVPGSAQFEDRAVDHTISADTSDGTLTVLAYSPSNEPFSGSEGPLFSVDLAIAGEGGTYDLPIQNAVLSDSTGADVLSDARGGRLTVISPQIELSESEISFGTIAVGDTSRAPVRITNTGGDTLRVQSANTPSSITTSLDFPLAVSPGQNHLFDVVAVGSTEGSVDDDVLLYSNDAARSPSFLPVSATYTAPNELSVSSRGSPPGGQDTLSIVLANETPISGLQFDLQFPSVLNPDVAGIFLTERKTDHTISAQTLPSGTVRVLAFSNSLAAFEGEEGPVVRVPLTVGSTTGTYAVEMQDAVLSDTTGADVTTDASDGAFVVRDSLAALMGAAEIESGGSVPVGSTAVTADLSSIDAPGLLVVERFDAPPSGATGIEELNVSPYRWKVETLRGLEAGGTVQLRFDPGNVAGAELEAPEEVVVYRRESMGEGTFTALATSYNSETGEIVAEDVPGFSEFVFAGDSELQPVHQVTITGTDGTGNPDDVGWRLLAPPSSATRGDFEDDLSFDVDSGHLLHTWEGTQWTPATNSSVVLPRGRGLILYFFDDNVDPIPSDGLTLDVPDEGENQTANVTIEGLNQSERFHLLGNPYDVAFDLGSLADGDLPGNGFQSTVQIWDPSGNGQWTTVTQGLTDDNIAAWQGFFLERQQPGNGGTSLTFDAEGRQSDSGDLIGSMARSTLTTISEAQEQARVELRLAVAAEADTVAQDGMTLLFHDQAEMGWDGYEASQLPPPNATAYATVSSPIQGEGDLLRRTLVGVPFPMEDTPIAVPLSVRSVETSGTATIRWPPSLRDALPDGWNVELVDTVDDTTANLRSESYSFDLGTGDGTIDEPENARFDLRVTPTTIPVELVDFAGRYEKESVRLTWKTASETDNAGFYIHRTSANEDWQRLGFVESKADGGTSHTRHSYHFRDADLPYAADSLVYQLRQVDTDGTIHRGERTVVYFDGPDQLTLHPPVPNPAPQQASLRFATPEPAEVRIVVYDLLGREVATLVDGRFEEGRHEEQLSATTLAPGLYFVRLQAEGETRTRKFTVVH